MAFRFPLDTVLRVRQGMEHQQELLLREANQRLMSVEWQAEKLNSALMANSARALQQMLAGTSAAELHFDLLCRSTLLERRRSLEKDVAEARAARDTRAASFRQARQQREIVETLRQHSFRLYHQVESRRQQREIDDVFLLLRNRAEHR